MPFGQERLTQSSRKAQRNESSRLQQQFINVSFRWLKEQCIPPNLRVLRGFAQGFPQSTPKDSQIARSRATVWP